MTSQSQTLPPTHPDSPDPTHTAPIQHLPLSDPMYNTSNSHLFNDHLVSSGLRLPAEYGHELDPQIYPPPPSSAKSNGGLPTQSSFRSSFTSFPNANRPRQGTTISLAAFREGTNFYPSVDPYAQHGPLTSPTMTQVPAYDSRAGYEYGPSAPLTNGLGSAHKVAFPLDYANGSKAQQSQTFPQSQPYAPTVQIASQTPYGPHIPVVNNTQQANVNPPASTHNQSEDISTIFVVGFPDDMQEREFQNMFTFSLGFEAATLKIPNKEYTAYGGMVVASGPGATRGGSYPAQYAGSSDPYNQVTVNQGGVVIDGGRDGTMSSWPPTEDGAAQPHFVGPVQMTPRKQIIGFAKFKSRDAALTARDQLQGRRVDAEKGAVLKAEMAKKNLHTKRGVGPVGGGGTTGPTPVHGGMMTAMGVPMPSDPYTLPPGLPADQTSPRERDYPTTISGTLGKVGSWRDHHLIADTLPYPGLNGIEDERRRDRDPILHSIGGPTRGPRERAEDDGWERRRKEKEAMFLRGHNTAAYDAFHSIPHSGSRSSAIFDGGLPQDHEENEAAGRRSTSPVIPPDPCYSPSREIELQSGASMFTNPFPSHQHPMQSSASSSSSIGGGSNESNEHVGDATLIASEKDIQSAMGNLDLTTSGEGVNGNASPELPSPSSNHSSVSTNASMRNAVDQNPPINTLYVGNLPTSSPPPGYPHDHLEDSLRELFASRPGFRRLCFRHKPNGPMCFVEFEDVTFATKALNDLYGNTLNGLVKGGGIRLSYSKNPLGVRTPTSAGGSGPTLQQSTSGPHFPYQNDVFPRQYGEEPRSFRSVQPTSPPPNSAGSNFSGSFMMTSPPPRFSVPASTFAGGASTFAPRSSSSYDYSGLHSSFSPFNISTPPHNSIPDQPIHEHEHHFMQGAISPPINHVEATRVG